MNLNIRDTDGTLATFRKECEGAGLDASAVIRDLCKAALPYLKTVCAPDKRWYPPKLSQHIATVETPTTPNAPTLRRRLKVAS